MENNVSAVVAILPNGLPQSVEEAYTAVLHVANTVLRKCKLFAIEGLQSENPTISEIATRLRVICGLMEQIENLMPSVDCTVAHKAKEYADHISLIAKAIDAGDETELALQVKQLDARSFL